MKQKDYYALLEVNKHSSKEEIKQNYRRLAKKYHPDANIGNPEMEEKFKDLTVGYDILIDKDKKKKYDRQVVRYGYGIPSKNTTKVTSKKYGVKNGDTANEFITTLLGFGKDATQAFKAKASDFKVIISSKKEAKKGENVEANLDISLEEGFFGAEKKLSLKIAGGKISAYTIQVPRGIKDGEKIRLAALGKPGKNGGKNGDLIITIRLKENEQFKLNGLDIQSTMEITYAQSMVGDKNYIKMFDQQVEVEIPAGTKENDIIIIENNGYINNIGERGKLILTVKVTAPKTISERERRIYEQLLRVEKQQSKDKQKV